MSCTDPCSLHIPSKRPARGSAGSEVLSFFSDISIEKMSCLSNWSLYYIVQTHHASVSCSWDLESGLRMSSNSSSSMRCRLADRVMHTARKVEE